jgi:hypothetical protein
MIIRLYHMTQHNKFISAEECNTVYSHLMILNTQGFPSLLHLNDPKSVTPVVNFLPVKIFPFHVKFTAP